MKFKLLFCISLISLIGCSKNEPEHSLVNDYIDACRNDDLVSVYKMLCQEDRKSISLQDFVTLINEKKIDNVESSISSNYEFIETVITKNNNESNVIKLVSLSGHNSKVWSNEKLYFKALSIAKVVNENGEDKIKLNLDKLNKHNELREIAKREMLSLMVTSYKMPDSHSRENFMVNIKFLITNFTGFEISNPKIRFIVRKFKPEETIISEDISLHGYVDDQEENSFWADVYNKDKILKRYFDYFVKTEFIDAELDDKGKIRLESLLEEKCSSLGIENYYNLIPVLMNLGRDVDLM